MNRSFIFLQIIISFLVFSCKGLPVIESGKAGLKPGIGPFLKNKYQLTHSIKADLPNGDTLLVLGVTIADPVQRSIHAVMMTVEGLVLFEIDFSNDSVTLNRSMPMQGINPLDFAKSLIDDLKLIYFTPDCYSVETGYLNNSYIKRYNCNDGTVDVIEQEKGDVDIIKYEKSNGIIRKVNIYSINKEGLPDKLELSAPGIFGYTLFLELVNFEKI